MSKVDFHFHLEEGPYSWRWLQRTYQSMKTLSNDTVPDDDEHTMAWMRRLMKVLQTRITQGPFSEDWIKAYLTQGHAKGIHRFGLVDHLYRFDEFRSYYEKHIQLDDTDLGRMQRAWLNQVAVGSINEFLNAARSVQLQGYPLSIGVEADYFPGGEAELAALLDPYELDYVIGSVHFFEGWGFDNPETRHLFEERELLELYQQEFAYVKRAAESGLFQIIAHLDNLKVFNYRPDEPQLYDLYHDVAAVLKRCHVATEINTGLAYRYPVREMCPSPSLLKVLHQHRVPITLSSDAHFPDDIGSMLDEARDLAKSTGYEEMVYFVNKQRRTISLLDDH